MQLPLEPSPARFDRPPPLFETREISPESGMLFGCARHVLLHARQFFARRFK